MASELGLHHLHNTPKGISGLKRVKGLVDCLLYALESLEVTGILLSKLPKGARVKKNNNNKQQICKGFMMSYNHTLINETYIHVYFCFK